MTHKVVVVTGCGGPAGQATVRRLLADGAVVIGADANREAVDRLRDSLGPEGERFTGRVVDLLDESATREWAAEVTREHGHVDGVAHLVGGWRGGKSFADNALSDSDLLFSLLVRTLQTTSLAFHDALVASAQGRFVIISAVAAQRPDPGSASYAAAKAAAETWTMALAASFRALQAAASEPLPQRAAAVVLVVKALLTDAMREAKPQAKFAGFTHVSEVADTIADLWSKDAADLNGIRMVLAS